MALATLQDLEDRLGRTLEPSETTRADLLLEEASDMVASYCNQDFTTAPDFAPLPVVRVVAKIAARALVQGSREGVESLTAGPFSTHYVASASSGDGWLSAADKLALKPYRRSSTSVPMYGDRYVNADWDDV